MATMNTTTNTVEPNRQLEDLVGVIGSISLSHKMMFANLGKKVETQKAKQFDEQLLAAFAGALQENLQQESQSFATTNTGSSVKACENVLQATSKPASNNDAILTVEEDDNSFDFYQRNLPFIALASLLDSDKNKERLSSYNSNPANKQNPYIDAALSINNAVNNISLFLCIFTLSFRYTIFLKRYLARLEIKLQQPANITDADRNEWQVIYNNPIYRLKIEELTRSNKGRVLLTKACTNMQFPAAAINKKQEQALKAKELLVRKESEALLAREKEQERFAIALYKKPNALLQHHTIRALSVETQGQSNTNILQGLQQSSAQQSSAMSPATTSSIMPYQHKAASRAYKLHVASVAPDLLHKQSGESWQDALLRGATQIQAARSVSDTHQETRTQEQSQIQQIQTYSAHSAHKRQKRSAKTVSSIFAPFAPALDMPFPLQMLFAGTFDDLARTSSRLEQFQIVLPKLAEKASVKINFADFGTVVEIDRTTNEESREEFAQQTLEVNKYLDDFYKGIQKELKQMYRAPSLATQKDAAETLARMTLNLIRLQLHSLPTKDIYEALKQDFQALMPMVSSSIEEDKLPQAQQLHQFSLPQMLQIGYHSILDFATALQGANSRGAPRYEDYLKQMKAVLTWLEIKYQVAAPVAATLPAPVLAPTQSSSGDDIDWTGDATTPGDDIDWTGDATTPTRDIAPNRDASGQVAETLPGQVVATKSAPVPAPTQTSSGEDIDWDGDATMPTRDHAPNCRASSSMFTQQTQGNQYNQPHLQQPVFAF